MKPARPAFTRRQVLRIAGAAGAAAALPRGLAVYAHPLVRGRDDRRLVLLFLEGGNDGLNTVVPFEDDRYAAARPRLRLRGSGLVRLDDQTALHPALRPLETFYGEGRLAVLRDVGYDPPDRSHFLSRDIWHSGRRHPGGDPAGWVGRALESQDPGRMPAVALGVGEAPLILKGRTRRGLTLDRLEDFRVRVPESVRGGTLAALEAGADAEEGPAARISRLAKASYTTAERLRRSIEEVPAGDGYPATALAGRLRMAARLVRAEGGPPVLWTHLGGFDTHALQAGSHAALLGDLAAACAAFAADLSRDGTLERTLLLAYSEFGRRVRENGSEGTDHGAAGPVLALGSVRGGLHGDPPDLENLLDGDVRPQTDFRAVFREAAGRFLGWNTSGLFDRDLPPPGFTA